MSYHAFPKQATHLNQFLEALYTSPVPQPGLLLQVIYYVNGSECEFSAQCPDHHKIASIPEDVSKQGFPRKHVEYLIENLLLSSS